MAYTFILLLALAYTLHTLLRLLLNIRTARQSGLPYTLSPLHELEGWAYVTDPLLRWACRGHVLRRGRGWPRWARFMVKDWHYEDRGRAHAELGDVFLVVSPGGLVCYVGSAEVAVQVLVKRRAFVKPVGKMKMLEPFGQNVVSTDGNLWRFHLSITLPPLAADGVHRTVWDESRRQVGMMTRAWNAANVKTSIYTLTVNTMCLAGFGRKVADWAAEGECAVPPGHTLSLVGSILGVVMHLPHILLLPKWALARSPWRAAYRAYVEFEQYMDELLASEKRRLEKGKAVGDRENLLTAVLESNMAGSSSTAPFHGEGRGSSIAELVGRTSLTDEEIKGNVFIFLLAGYDTTANTILFSLIVLALYPDIQQRIINEIDKIHKAAASEGRSELSFTDDYPKFRYLVAFMHEVMRVFPIVLPLARVTAGAQRLHVAGTTHSLPPGTGVIVNNTAIHYAPAQWPSPEVIEPRRWLARDPHSYDPGTADKQKEPDDGEDDEEAGGGGAGPMLGYRKGTFMTFGEGPRACLGRRFARVEFVAVFSALLRRHRLVLAEEEGRSASEVERVLRRASGGSPVTLIPPEEVKIRLVER